MSLNQAASDNFTRANENPLSDGGKWTNSVTVPLQLLNDVCTCAGGASGAYIGNAYYSGITWGNDQYTQVVISAIPSGTYVVPLVRCNSSLTTWYQANIVSGSKTIIVYKNVAGVSTSIGTYTSYANPAVGDIWVLQVIGTTLTVYQNGILCAGTAITDSSIASGSPGMYLYNTTVTQTAVSISSWIGGQTSAATPTFGLASGPYNGQQTTTITSATSGSTIYYTTDGSTPTISSASISNGSSVTVTPSVLLQAIAVHSGNTNSPVAQAYYTQTFGVWVPQGTVIAQGAGGTNVQAGQPTMLYEGNAQILSGNVFKMWYGNTEPSIPGIFYAESTDGINFTQYGSNPVIVNGVGQRIFKNGSTYYMYCGTQGNFNPGNTINVFTSSDGVNWTLAKANAIVASATWEGTAVFQLSVLGIVGGIWYGYYTGNGTSPQLFAEGLATSTDGINWTKGNSNPVIPFSSGNFTFGIFGTTYYAWSQSVAAQADYFTGAFGYKWDIFRWTASDPAGPWSQISYQGEVISTYFPTGGTDWYTGQSNLQAELGDPQFLQVSGDSWIYYSVGYGGTPLYYINAAKAPSTTLEQIASTYEGLIGIPSSGNPYVNFVTLASDNFTRADVNPIGGNWSPYTLNGAVAAKIVSDVVESSSISLTANSWWNALSWEPDQWASITIGTCTGGSVGIALRQSTQNASVSYQLYWTGTLGTSGTFSILKTTISGSTITNTALATLSGATVQSGDTIVGIANGTQLGLYWNNVLVLTATDSAIANGAAGFRIVPNGSTTGSATITAWAGGTFQASLTYEISGNAGIAGASISWEGPVPGSGTADAFGNYTLTNLVNGTYTITPSKTGYTFSPGSATEVINGGNITGINFTAIKTGSGGSGEQRFGFGFNFKF